jgi:hypothetical protein
MRPVVSASRWSSMILAGTMISMKAQNGKRIALDDRLSTAMPDKNVEIVPKQILVGHYLGDQAWYSVNTVAFWSCPKNILTLTLSCCN